MWNPFQFIKNIIRKAPFEPDAQQLHEPDTQDVSSHLSVESEQDKERDCDDRDGYLQYQENGLNIQVDLKKDVTTIGRSSQMDCSIEGSCVSRRHAKFVRANNSYYVIDTDSKCGTYVNERKIDDRYELHEGDVIRLANIPITFLRRSGASSRRAVSSNFSS